jgi:repressor LexA
MKATQIQSLTKKQKTVYNFIKSWYTRKGYPPTIREIASHIGVKSTNAVHNYLKILYRKGFLTREDMKSRTWRPVESEESRSTVAVPVLGRIAAGLPILADENRMGTIQMDPSLVQNAGESFALQVSGDSMIEAGIHDGDYVFVNPISEIESGDIVAAIIGDEATVKYFYREKNAIRLQPANKNMAPIYLKLDRSNQIETTIVGKITVVYRKLF